MPSQKVLAAKEKIVAELTDEFKQAQAMVFADYRGLTVDQDTQMRSALRKGDVVYKVVKNSMSERAMKNAGYTDLDIVLKGPTAVAYSCTDVVMPAKIIKEFADKFDSMSIKGGVLEGRIISVDEVNRLAAIPTKEVLYSQLVFGLISPLTKLVMLLNAVKEKAEEAGIENVSQFVNTASVEATAELTN